MASEPEFRVTLRDIYDSGHWEDFTEAFGIDPRCLEDGLVDDDEFFLLPFSEMVRIGMVKRAQENH